MSRKFFRKEISIKNLRNDSRNPRHPELHGQVEIIEWMLDEHGQEIFNLAEDIITNGLSPIENILVLPSEEEKNCFVVAEGNRRFTAIRLLANPDLCHSTKWQKKFRDLADNNRPRVPKVLEVTVAQDRDSVEWILDRRHRGLDSGRGLRGWNAQQSARAQRTRDGKAARYEKALNVIDYAVSNSLLGSASKSLQDPGFPITTLERLLGDISFHSSLGISFNENSLVFTSQPDSANRALARVLSDLLNGLSVSEVKSKGLRSDYLNKIRDDLPPPDDKLDQPLLADDAPKPKAPPTISGASPNPPSGRNLRDPSKRKKLITESMKVKDINIRKVYNELYSIDLDSFPHSASCLLRVFAEQSFDLYIEQNAIQISTKDRSGRATLRERMHGINQALSKRKKIPLGHQKAINAACNANGSLADPDNLHMKLHSKYHFAHKKDLIHIWDTTYGPLLKAIWDEIN